MRTVVPENTASPLPAASLHSAYEGKVARREIQPDDAQRTVLQALQDLLDSLTPKPKAGLLGGLFKKTDDKPTAQGLYIWGNVGRGKSMLMDLFFEHALIPNKRRVHFHAFMQEVHARIHKIRTDSTLNKSGTDPVILLARQIADETALLCFDELQAHDVTDATLLYRLFSSLFEAGVIIVSTSNRPPVSIYTGGVQRERFAKFIELLETSMQVISLSSPQDYRLSQVQAMQTTYFHPLGNEAEQFITDTISSLCTNSKPQRATVHVHGRALDFTTYEGTIGRFTFQELCEKPLGAADYLALATSLDTVILTGVPKLSPEKRNEAKRFVTLIDALYEHKITFICTAAAAPEKLYAEGDGAFEFQRTVSRLKEMQSAKWISS